MTHESTGVSVRMVDWAHVKWAKVRLWHEGGEPTDLLVTPDDGPLIWDQRVAGQDYQYQVMFADHTGQVIEGDTHTASSASLVVMSPFEGELSGGVWLSRAYDARGGRLAVAVRYQDEARGYRREFALHAGAGEGNEWSIPILDAERRTYEYNATIMLNDGHRETGWIASDKPFLPFGPPGPEVDVKVIPLISPTNRLAKVTFAYEGEQGVQRREFVFHSPFPSDEMLWVFFADDEDYSYRYQATVYDEAGVPHVQPERTTNEEIVIILDPETSS